MPQILAQTKHLEDRKGKFPRQSRKSSRGNIFMLKEQFQAHFRLIICNGAILGELTLV